MIINLKRTIGYVCPYCSELSAAGIDAFSLPKNGSINALCGFHSNDNVCASIKRGKDKLTINVKCPICERVHTFRTAEKSFWSKELIIYQCPETAINIFYLGEDEKVHSAIEEYEEMLEEETDDLYDEEFEDETAEHNIMTVMLGYLHTLKSIHELSCVCGSENIYITGSPKEVVLTCRRCGRSKSLAVTERNLNLLLYRKPVIIE